ncbi:MAG: peptidoglycan recognition protein family protein [Lacrimispora sphenoides]
MEGQKQTASIRHPNTLGPDHYYVEFDGEVWQSVEVKDIAWHCGAKSYVRESE